MSYNTFSRDKNIYKGLPRKKTPKIHKNKLQIKKITQLSRIMEELPEVSTILQEMLDLKDLDELDNQSDFSDEGTAQHSKNLLFWSNKDRFFFKNDSFDQGFEFIKDDVFHHFDDLSLK